MSVASLRLKFSSVSAPDVYYFGNGKRPSDRFVISRNVAGGVLTYYSYQRWDFSPYSRPTQRERSIVFPTPTDEKHKVFVEDLKWLTFIFLFHKKGKKRGAVGTLVHRYRLLLIAFTFALEFDLSVCSLFSNAELIEDLFYTLSKSKKKELLIVVRSLSKMTPEELGFDVVSVKDKKILSLKNPKFDSPSVKQTAIIPERIYSHCAYDLSIQLEEFNAHATRLTDFLDACLANSVYGRSITSQRLRGLKKSTFVHTFGQASDFFDLAGYFTKYKINSLDGLCHHLMITQFRSKSLIHMYSGMRDEEVLSMRYNCVETVKVKKNDVVTLLGVTTKLEKGEEKNTYWISCAEVLPGIEAAKTICRIVSKANQVAPENMYLFITPSHLPISKRHHGLVKLSEKTFVISSLMHHFYNSEAFFGDEYRITPEDQKLLKQIDFSRDWTKEPAFQVGNLWPFATHQFRRSLAVYSLSSRLVSLTSLKRQLKHISLAMTLYYVRGCLQHVGMFDLHQNFKEEVLALRDTVAALDYINLAFSSQPLLGAQGTYIERRVKPLGEEAILILRDETIKRANKGEFRYVNTHMGGCVSPQPCGKPLISPLSSCLHCSKSVLDPERVNETIVISEAHCLKLSEGPEKTTLDSEIKYLKSFLSMRNK